MLGFGFNRDKIRASAERFVQQGRLQNAIAEYDKILKQDPKDLTVLNTVGDLYSRLGQIDQAVVFFKLVGDTYAAEGFVPKAIAMYKKLTKISPNTLECVQKLGELYTQQGLYNDARAQLLIVADIHEREGRKGDAVRAYLRIRDLDPDNFNVITKLARLYRSQGNTAEAAKLLMGAAEALRSRNMLDAADDALLNLLQADPSNSRAIEMRGALALERGEPTSAIALLEKVPDIDSRQEPLQLLLRAQLALSRFADAEPAARKLLTVHNNCSGLLIFTEKLFSSDPKRALAVCEEFSDRLIAADRQAVISRLRGAVSSLSNDVPALETLLELFERSGDISDTGDINELIAHASVKSGDLARARDLYLKLAQLEPANTTHAQNYRQVMEMMGADAAMIGEPLNNLERPFAMETVSIEEPPADDSAGVETAAPASEAYVAEAATVAIGGSGLEFGSAEAPLPPPPPVASATEFTVVEPTPPAAAGTVHEIDISAEWESAANVEQAKGESAVVNVEQTSTPAPALAHAATEAQVSDLVEEITFYVSQSMWSEARFACGALEKMAPANAELVRLRSMIPADTPPTPIEPAETIEVAPPPKPEFEQHSGITRLYDLDSEADLTEATQVAAPAPPPVPVAPPSQAAPAVASAAQPAPAARESFLDHFTEDLDKSLGSDFNLGAAPSAPVPGAAPAAAAPVVRAEVATPAPAATESAAPAAEADPNSTMLDDLFHEFKEEMDDESGTEDDPETHYSLGVAFKEMGLLDEAIGELQKVCQLVEHGLSFSQTIQAYTWLANCFVEKGVPEASFKWYQRALSVATSNDQRLAIHYELAAAYEAAGFRQEALTHYMEVYTTNIDYRDVGERIKALRS